MIPVLIGLGVLGYFGYKSYEKYKYEHTPAQEALRQPGGAPLPIQLDSNMDEFHRAEVTNLLYYNNDYNILASSAVGYSQAGYPIAASLLAQKAISLSKKAA